MLYIFNIQVNIDSKMWSVVAFDQDNSVEVVPSKGFDKKVCAWP